MRRFLRLSSTQRTQVLDHVIRNLPEEACGLLGGRECSVEVVIPVTNRLHSTIRFFMEPSELLNALEQLEANGLELVGIFHSHPHGPPTPSEIDLQEFSYPESLMVIISPQRWGWQLRAFEIDINKRAYQEVDLVIERE